MAAAGAAEQRGTAIHYPMNDLADLFHCMGAVQVDIGWCPFPQLGAYGDEVCVAGPFASVCSLSAASRRSLKFDRMNPRWEPIRSSTSN